MTGPHGEAQTFPTERSSDPLTLAHQRPAIPFPLGTGRDHHPLDRPPMLRQVELPAHEDKHPHQPARLAQPVFEEEQQPVVARIDVGKGLVGHGPNLVMRHGRYETHRSTGVGDVKP